eukprot:3711853-Prorocentrum_lima.AAC.1
MCSAPNYPGRLAELLNGFVRRRLPYTLTATMGWGQQALDWSLAPSSTSTPECCLGRVRPSTVDGSL